jgi:hypothetical protein
MVTALKPLYASTWKKRRNRVRCRVEEVAESVPVNRHAGTSQGLRLSVQRNAVQTLRRHDVRDEARTVLAALIQDVKSWAVPKKVHETLRAEEVNLLLPHLPPDWRPVFIAALSPCSTFSGSPGTRTSS